MPRKEANQDPFYTSLLWALSPQVAVAWTGYPWPWDSIALMDKIIYSIVFFLINFLFGYHVKLPEDLQA